MAKLKEPNCYVVFLFSDESEREFYIKSYETYNALQDGDTGTLSYKQLKNSTKWSQRSFISFEKDE